MNKFIAKLWGTLKLLNIHHVLFAEKSKWTP